jgi:hypothetical protein
MTESPGFAQPRAAASSLSAPRPEDRFSSTFVGWLIQTALIAVVEGTCETLSGSRGSNEGQRPVSSPRFAFPLKFYQHALISKAGGRESKLSPTGHVAGQRRRRRAVFG